MRVNIQCNHYYHHQTHKHTRSLSRLFMVQLLLELVSIPNCVFVYVCICVCVCVCV